MRVIPLAADLSPLEQAELALEGLSPFPPAQLYWGCCVSPDRAQAVLYGAHRRLLPAQEMAAWESEDLLVPEVLTLVGAAPASPRVLVLVGENRLSGAAWSENSGAWPAAVLARACNGVPTEEERLHFATELAERAGHPAAPVDFLQGKPHVRHERDQLTLELHDAESGEKLASTVVAAEHVGTLDVRDRDFLQNRQRTRRRREIVWLLLVACAAAAALALAADCSALGFRLLTKTLERSGNERAALVTRLETANTLTTRINALTERRLRFFEMLSVANSVRPPSIKFTRTNNSGRTGLEIEGQTGTAEDIGAYEAALRTLPAVDKLETRDIRSREGVTTFVFNLLFKPGAQLQTPKPAAMEATP